jgi:CHASE2 domain-containing sensor protein
LGGNRDEGYWAKESWPILALVAWSLFYALSFESRPRTQMAVLVTIVPIVILAQSTRLTLIGWVDQPIKAESCQPLPNRVS